jgi:hypothetical protein
MQRKPVPDPKRPGRFLSAALDEFVQADPGRQALTEARALAEAGRNDEAYRLLCAALRGLGRWRQDAAAALVEIAMKTTEPLPRLSDDLAELVRTVKGSGQSLLPVLEVFELAGHEERKELLFDHIADPAEAGAADAVLSERIAGAAARGNWASPLGWLGQLIGKSVDKRFCFALWETAATLVFPEREPWSAGQLDGKLTLPEPAAAIARTLLELKVLRATAARPGAQLWLPRPAATAGAPVRPMLEGFCRAECRLREIVALWADVAMLITRKTPSISQAEIIDRLTEIAASASPTAACRMVPRDAFLRRRLDARVRESAELLLADLGRRCPAGKPPAGMTAVAAGTLKGRSMGIPAFFLSEYLVTRAQFAAFDPAVELRRGEESRPMTNLNWFQARAYARKLGGRLPQTCEWWWALKSRCLPLNAAGTVVGSPAPGPEQEETFAEWSDDWTLAGAEKVRLNAASRAAAPGAPPVPTEAGLSPVDKDPRLGFRAAM